MFRGYFRSFPVQTRRTEPPRGEGEEVSAPCSQPRRLHDLRVGTGAGHAADPNPTRRILLRLPACLVLRPFFSSSTERRRRDLGSPSLGRPFVLGAEQRGLCPFLKQRGNQQSSTFAIGHPETKGWNSWLNQPTTVGLQLCKFFSASIQPKRKGEEKENRIASHRISPSHEDATSDSPRLRVTGSPHGTGATPEATFF